jgi:hypothetical protein
VRKWSTSACLGCPGYFVHDHREGMGECLLLFGQTEGETWGRICRAVDVRTVETTLRKAIITPIDGTDEGLARRGPAFYPMAPWLY